jgi:hypothetical protein
VYAYAPMRLFSPPDPRPRPNPSNIHIHPHQAKILLLSTVGEVGRGVRDSADEHCDPHSQNASCTTQRYAYMVPSKLDLRLGKTKEVFLDLLFGVNHSVDQNVASC